MPVNALTTLTPLTLPPSHNRSSPSKISGSGNRPVRCEGGEARLEDSAGVAKETLCAAGGPSVTKCTGDQRDIHEKIVADDRDSRIRHRQKSPGRSPVSVRVPQAELSLEPAAEPLPKSAAEPLPKPVAEPLPKPAAEPLPKPAAEPAAEPSAEPAAEPAEHVGGSQRRAGHEQSEARRRRDSPNPSARGAPRGRDHASPHGGKLDRRSPRRIRSRRARRSAGRATQKLRTPAKVVIVADRSSSLEKPSPRAACRGWSWSRSRSQSRSRSLRRRRARSRDVKCARVVTVMGGPEKQRPQRAPRMVGFGVVYWGGVGHEGWDLDHWHGTPRMCNHCDSVTDSWRGRFDNAHVTLRMCAAEGTGFKRYVHRFSMLSSRACVDFHFPSFYRWSVAQKKKVLTERIVLGSILGVHAGHLSPRDCGIRVSNTRGSWERLLEDVAQQLRHEARSDGGRFAALLLDGGGQELRAEELLRRGGRETGIGRLLIVLGGPDGIPDARVHDVASVLRDYLDMPMFRCALPGGKMHSYYALGTLFALHDQGLLFPMLSRVAGLA
mmetsp:Transcript_22447/g.62786  ORF Transcript_22447/g.62786 Transcript_22447/m.62786 type:complete len:552 (+) Transcript_22447:114-1769(+)